MSGALPQDDGVFGFWRPETTNDPFNAMVFLIESILSGVNVATLVQVKTVNVASRISAAGTVDVVPMVNQITGAGAAVPHTTIYGLPFIRIQGGANALICDPQVGDVGVALFCDKDISSVKANGATSNPGSMRRFSYSDGIYIGGWGRTAPTHAIILDSSGCEITSSLNLTSGGVLKVAGTQVVGAQQPHITFTGGGANPDPVSQTAISSILSVLQTHGLTA